MTAGEARERLQRAVLRRLLAHLAERGTVSPAGIRYADDDLAVAARDLVAATDALPDGDQPAMWSFLRGRDGTGDEEGTVPA